MNEKRKFRYKRKHGTKEKLNGDRTLDEIRKDFLPVKSLSQHLIGVRCGNHIGGGALSCEDSRAIVPIPY